MADYEKMYHILFKGISDAAEILKRAQISAEELYIKEGCKILEFKRDISTK